MGLYGEGPILRIVMTVQSLGLRGIYQETQGSAGSGTGKPVSGCFGQWHFYCYKLCTMSSLIDGQKTFSCPSFVASTPQCPSCSPLKNRATQSAVI